MSIMDEEGEPVYYYSSQSAVLPEIISSWKADRLRGKEEAKKYTAMAKTETDPVKKQ